MKKLIKEDGVLTDDGRKFLSEFSSSLEKILSSGEVNEMSISETRSFGSALSQIIGKEISKSLVKKTDDLKNLQSMSNEEFYEYLKEEYGDMWQLTSLTQNEICVFRAALTEDFEKEEKEADLLKIITYPLYPRF